MRSVLLLSFVAATAEAYSGGVIGYSGKDSSSLCTSCHAVGAGTNPTVAFSGPSTLAAGATGTYSFTITGGPATAASGRTGINIAVSNAAAILNVVANSTKKTADELYHSSPLPLSGGSVTYQFTVTAPASGNFTIYGAGNSCNGSGSGGDRSAYTTLNVSVMSANQAPTVATAAMANPAPVTNKTSTLSVLGADDNGEAALTYTWSQTSGPAGVTFSTNGTNAAKSTVATFPAPGAYGFSVSIKDAANLTATSSVNVTVNNTLTTVAVTPNTAGVALSGTQQFAASGTNQFGTAMTVSPTWTVSGGGTINATGLFTAGNTAGGPFTVTAAQGGRMGTATVTVSAGAPPTVATAASAPAATTTAKTTALSVLGADASGEAALTYTWAAAATAPAPVTFSVNGTNAAKNTVATFAQAGTYPFTVTLKDATNLTATSSVTVTVNAAADVVSVTPAMSTLAPGATVQLAASAVDQFGSALATAPAFTWSTSGGGSVSSTGLFTAGSSVGGPFTVTATTAAGKSGTASVTIASSGIPTIAQPASATPANVIGKTATLRALGADDQGEAALTYTWAAGASAPAPVTFSVNGTNAARVTVATFEKAGSYPLEVTVKDAAGATATSTVTITVSQTLSALSVTPGTVAVTPGDAMEFSAAGADQFGSPFTSMPPVVWSTTGGGTIDPAGTFTARLTPGGPFTVSATAAGLRGTALVNVGETQPEPLKPEPSQPEPKQPVVKPVPLDAPVEGGCSSTGNQTALFALVCLSLLVARRGGARRATKGDLK